jgi:HEAT repeat protein
LVAGCIDLLRERRLDPDLVIALAGPPGRSLLAVPDDTSDYWYRVWGARGLLWVWEDSALPAILAACNDDAWRVREMALKVIGRHRLGDALDAVSLLVTDPVPRVRSAARRTLERLTAAGA